MARLFKPELVRPIELARWEAIWRLDHNPAAAWRCYRLARAWGLSIPLSVSAEIDRIAAGFEAVIRDDTGAKLDHPTVGRLVAQGRRGSADPAAGVLRWERDIAIASAVGVLRQGGASEAEALDHAAKGTTGLAYVLQVGESIAFGAISTPAISPAAIRRAVRRVATLDTSCHQIADLKNATPAA